MSKPIIKIKPTGNDIFLEVIAGLAVVLLIVLPILYYSQLPDIIPRHYDLNGEPDAFGRKRMIWLLPGIGTFLYLVLSFVNQRPHLFNYPVKITEENARFQYRNAVNLIRMLKLLIMLVFLFMTYRTITIALGENAGLGKVFLPIFLGIILLILGGYVFNAIRKRRVDDHLR